jgi:signal peptidase
MKEQKTILKTIDKIFSAILILFIIVSSFASLFFTYYRSQNKLVNLFGYSVCYVLTGSMEPTLEVGDAILIKKENASQIEEGDIITYLSTTGPLIGNYITHEVIEKNGTGENVFFITKGEANLVADTEIITPDKIQGVYVKKLAFIKFLMSILSKPINFVLLIVLPLLIVVGMQITNFILELKKKDKNN